MSSLSFCSFKPKADPYSLTVDEDFVVPINYAAANLEDGEVTASDCCAKAKDKDSNTSPEISTDSMSLFSLIFRNLDA